METIADLQCRRYGSTGPAVVVLHGGPGAAGSARGMALGLAATFRVIEPWQRGSGDEPLTVARHVADLRALLCEVGEGAALVGESWGAMLALAYGAAHPDTVGPIALVGCGTFDLEARARYRQTLDERTTGKLRERIEQLEREIADPSERMRRQHELSERVYEYDPVHLDDPAAEPSPPFDLRAHLEAWEDMLRLQAEGVYPAAFAAIRTPVLMLHGDYDPHPGRMILATLQRWLPQIEHHELERCGHSPWNERHARDAFFAILRAWLANHAR